MKRIAVDHNYSLGVSVSQEWPPPEGSAQTHFSGFFILCEHLVSLFLPLFLLQLLSGQRVAVVVSRQQTEITVLLRVKVETWQLWTQKIESTCVQHHNAGIQTKDQSH